MPEKASTRSASFLGKVRTGTLPAADDSGRMNWLCETPMPTETLLGTETPLVRGLSCDLLLLPMDRCSYHAFGKSSESPQ